MSDVYLRQAIREVAKIYCGQDGIDGMIGNALQDIIDRADEKDEEHEKNHAAIIDEIGQF